MGTESVVLSTNSFLRERLDCFSYASYMTELLDVFAIRANIHGLLARIGQLTGANVIVDDLIDPGSTSGDGGRLITITLGGASNMADVSGENIVALCDVNERNLDAAAHELNDKYGLRMGEIRVNDEQGVRLAYVEFGNAKIELMEPLRADSPVTKFLERNVR